jgi:hypothetical protein
MSSGLPEWAGSEDIGRGSLKTSTPYSLYNTLKSNSHNTINGLAI